LRIQQLGSIYEGLLEHHFVLEKGRLTLKTDRTSSDFKAVFRELKGEWIEHWPVRRIEFSTPAKSRTSLLAKAAQVYQRVLSDGNADGVLSFVAEQLAAKRNAPMSSMTCWPSWPNG